MLRGSSFAFRKEVVAHVEQRGTSAPRSRSSSVLVPFCMGAVAGAIASGRVPAGGKAGDPWSSWINPTSILGGVLAVTVCAYLAAVYLVWDARRLGDRRWSSTSGAERSSIAVVAGVVAFVGIFVLHDDADVRLRRAHVARAAARHHLRARAASGRSCCSLRDAHAVRASSRSARSATVVARVGRRAVALHAPDDAEGVAGGGARSGTLTTILVVFVIAAIVILPSLGLLYVLDQKSLLEPDQ